MLRDLAQIDRPVHVRREHVGFVRPLGVHLDGFRPDGQPDRFARGEGPGDRGPPRARSRFHVDLAGARGLHPAGDERRFADELRDEPAGRALVDLLRRADLQQAAPVEDRQPVGDGQRLLLVVGDVDRGQAGLFADAADFRAHLQAQLGVEIGQRFVQQQALRLDDQGAGQRDALLLAAGQLVGLGVRAVGQLDEFQRAQGARADLGPLQAAHFEAEGDVFAQGQVRPEGIALEDHAHVAPVRRQMRHVAVAGQDAAFLRLVEARHGAQERRLAAARRSEQEKQLAGFDAQIDAGQHRLGSEPLRQFFDRDGHRHGGHSFRRPPSSTLPPAATG